ncbi:MAG TPA: histidine phosphatase family protein [Syntrophorhabdaceae bacterium]|nr:histidine phosphatase family protein [Syntrophorhabdaceae bacterium]
MFSESPTRVFLVRHGETLDEETGKVYKGTIDIPLSRKGIERIEKVADYLAPYPLAALYTSALSRCIESASIIGRPHKLSAHIDERFNELHFGKWEGLSFHEIEKTYPVLFPLWLKDPVSNTPPGGEALLDAQKRATKAFEEIVDRHKGGSIAIVCHAGILKIIISTLLNLSLTALYKLSQDYGCVDIIDMYDDNSGVIKLLNYTV